MRHYVPKKNNPNVLPHNLYMQMLYLIRDYNSRTMKEQAAACGERLWQWQAVCQSEEVLKAEYEKRPESFEAFEPLRAFFDYAYFSYMYTRTKGEMGAGKRSWNLYRCRFACMVAESLGLYASGFDSRPCP
ncbi:MAG: hypothetical protein IKD21_05985 [Clostridia bacterium]|nr:hypothetical protein [Clostridia bacterium]